MSEDAHWSGIDAVALKDLRVCATCGEIREGLRCPTCPRLRAGAERKAEQLVAAGVTEVTFCEREDDAPSVLAYRMFVREEFARRLALRRQSEAIGELRHAQRAAELYAKLPRVEAEMQRRRGWRWWLGLVPMWVLFWGAAGAVAALVLCAVGVL